MAHLLLVDDDPACLAALAQGLHYRFGCQRLQVDAAQSAATALILAHTHRYDALIVDPILSGVTRFKFVEQLAHFQPGVPLIVISGFDVEWCEEEVRRLGFTGFLTKPIDFSQLCNGLTAVLPGPRTQARRPPPQLLARARLLKRRASARRR
jgi:DNA-binding response OmpR family regulator